MNRKKCRIYPDVCVFNRKPTKFTLQMTLTGLNGALAVLVGKTFNQSKSQYQVDAWETSHYDAVVHPKFTSNLPVVAGGFCGQLV